MTTPGWLPWTRAAAPRSQRRGGWRGPWEVIRDPSRAFLGGRFNWDDIEWGAVFGAWPEGITFRHIRSGRTLQYTAGQLLELTREED